MRLLSNEDLASVCDVGACIDALYDGLRAYDQGQAVRRPRIDLYSPTDDPARFGCFSTMDGLVRGGYYALRVKPDVVVWPESAGVRRRTTYCVRPGLYGGLVLVFRVENAELVAIMNDGYIQHLRVAALGALGARYLSRPDASTLGVLGSGGMARAFALAYAAVRPLKRVRAYSPDAEHREAFCREVGERLGIDAQAVPDAEQAVRGADIVALCTNAIEPVITGRVLEPGMYISRVTQWETGPDVLGRVSLIGHLLRRQPLELDGFSDHNFEVRPNAMAYLAGAPEERARIPRFREPGGSVVSTGARRAPCVDWSTGGNVSGRQEDDIAVLAELSGHGGSGHASAGIQGLEFAAVAGRAYELAAARGLGRELPLDWFLQDIPT